MQQFQTPEYEHKPSPESHIEPLPAQSFIQEFQIDQYTHDPQSNQPIELLPEQATVIQGGERVQEDETEEDGFRATIKPRGQAASGKDDLGDEDQIDDTMLPQLSVDKVEQLGLPSVPTN